jgi:prepilin-type N-terminal cleavage/methylation domain-containing protein
MNLRKGFTLIEMMVVIAIIIILASLLIPAVMKAIRKAKERRAATTAKNYALALECYYREYGAWPANVGDDSSATKFDGSHVEFLSGTTTNDNSRKIRFMEFPEGESGLKDPWGNYYKFVLDKNYDGKVSVNGKDIKREIAIWSLGVDGKEFTKDDVKTWN